MPTCGDKSATLQHTFHALSVHHTELADVSHGTAVRFSQEDLAWTVQAKKKNNEGALHAFCSQLGYGAN